MSHNYCILCPYGLDRGLLSKAVSLFKDKPITVFLPEGQATEAALYGAAEIHTIPQLPADERQVALWLKERLLQLNCTVILAPATVQMRNIMPMLAMELGAGLTADCTDLSVDGSALLQIRPAFGNSLIATIKSLSKIQMATVRPGTFRPVENPNSTPKIYAESFEFSNSKTALIDSTPYADEIPLSQAQIIVAGGAGIGSKEGFEKLERLSQAIGGSIAASRNAVDAGYAPYHAQVGMTGVTVCPKLYIAVGISGAVQHLAGMSGAEKVIAINSDPKAPIFNYADYGIVGNWETVIDKIMEELI